MKRIILLTTLLATTLCFSYAQNLHDNINTIGIRVTNGVELSYQRYVAPSKRVEANVGLGRYGVDVTGIYQWTFPLTDIDHGEFRWYTGAGANTGAWTKSSISTRGFAFGVLGQIGSEYEFRNSPIILSLDYRPTLYFSPKTTMNWGNVGVSARYTF